MTGIEPFIIAAAAASATGSVAQGVGNFVQQKRQASILRSDANQARKIGAIEAANVNDDKARSISAFVAQQGASGFTLDGSAMAVIGDLASQFETQAQTARYDAARRSAALNNEADSLQASSKLSLLKGATDAAGTALIAASSGGGGGSG